MPLKIALKSKLQKGEDIIFLLHDPNEIPKGYFTPAEIGFIKRTRDKDKSGHVVFNRLDHWLYVLFIKKNDDADTMKEDCRKAGDKIQSRLNGDKVSNVTVYGESAEPSLTLALAEGLALGSYQFLKYKTDRKEANSLKEISVFSGKVSKKDISDLNAVLKGVCFTRDMINEPNSTLSAPVFAGEITKMAGDAGIRVDIFNKKKLESLQMGGILGVNKGSFEPPLLITLEWKPEKAKNRHPFIFVGKGVMFDTGGMNLKPGDFMNTMKCDMSGGAAVAGIMLAIAEAKLPVHVIGLIPATDNRPGEKALVSGDVIKMHDGTTVEVINTDAEGRLILADALSYAKKFKPQLVIDLATLTGAASRAIGKNGMVGMQSKAEKEIGILKRSGFSVFERIVEFPLWDDYAESLKSDVADLKNLGGTDAGAITAGKFLEKFTDYPYIHLDIAGPAYVEKRDTYRGVGGTGVGVRLLFNFLTENYV